MVNYNSNGGSIINGSYGAYVENHGGPATGVSGAYVEDNNFTDSTVINFASYFTPGTVLQSVQSDLGITSSGGKVSIWADQAGSNNYTQITGALQPSLSVGINGFPGILTDTSGVTLISSFTPAVFPIFVWSVFRVAGNSSGNGTLTGFGSGSLLVFVTNGTTTVSQYSGSAATGPIATGGNIGRCEAYFSNSINDYIKFGSSAHSSGVNTGASIGLPMNIGGGGFGLVAGEFFAIVYTNSLPSQTILDNLSAAVTAKYGASVLV